MKKQTVLPLLVGCGGKPVDLPVPQGAAILNGTYSGDAREFLEDQPTDTVLPAQLTATASYVSQQQYRASGTLKLGGTTYSFAGTGRGNFLVRLTPHYSPPQPGVEFSADLLLGGQKVGTLQSAYWHSPGNTWQDLVLRLGDGGAHWYSLKLERQSL